MLYNGSMPKDSVSHADIDWEGLAEYFVNETPADMSLADFTDNVVPTLEETSKTHIHYRDIRDHAYREKWLERRARRLIEKFPGLYTDAEVQYGILMEHFISQHQTLSPRDIASLTNTIQSLRSTLLNRDSASIAPSDSEEERLTRDNVVEIFNDMIVSSREALVQMAIDKLREPEQEGPVEA